VLLAESCNIALAEVTKPDIKVLTLGRLAGADQGYFRGECIETGVWPAGRQGAAIDIAANWGGGPVASGDGMRFVVPGTDPECRAEPEVLRAHTRGHVAQRRLRPGHKPRRPRSCPERCATPGAEG
jgi:hypothetical protein